MIIVNAMGKACPEPVVMTKTALEKGAEELEVYVDNPVSATNVKRFLEKAGFSVQLRDEDGRLVVAGVKKTPVSDADAPLAPLAAPLSVGMEKPSVPQSQTLSVLITRRILGGDDEELGEILIKSFLGTLGKLDTPPAAVALMNEGVKLALFDSSSCDHLKNLEQKGTAVLVCGTCTNHFGITEEVGVGSISNMFEILDAMTGTDKTLTL